MDNRLSLFAHFAAPPTGAAAQQDAILTQLALVQRHLPTRAPLSASVVGPWGDDPESVPPTLALPAPPQRLAAWLAEHGARDLFDDALSLSFEPAGVPGVMLSRALPPNGYQVQVFAPADADADALRELFAATITLWNATSAGLNRLDDVYTGGQPSGWLTFTTQPVTLDPKLARVTPWRDGWAIEIGADRLAEGLVALRAQLRAPEPPRDAYTQADYLAFVRGADEGPVSVGGSTFQARRRSGGSIELVDAVHYPEAFSGPEQRRGTVERWVASIRRRLEAIRPAEPDSRLVVHCNRADVAAILTRELAGEPVTIVHTPMRQA